MSSPYRAQLTYIDNLPNEVLGHIVRLVARSVDPLHGSSLSVCVNLLKVCRRWHALIMDDGFLWSFVHTTVQRYSLRDTYHRVQQQIERASSWPLHVSENTLQKDVSLFWIKGVAERLLNLRSLHIGARPSVLLDVVEIICVEMPPLLEELQIRYTAVEADDDDVYHLPSDLLILPSLRRPTLCCVQVTLHDLPHTLTKLHLESEMTAGHRYDIHDFFNVLINLSRLETLRVKAALENQSPHISLPTINLLHLQHLTITSERDIITSFLTQLCGLLPTLRMKLFIVSPMQSSWQIAHNLLPPLRKRFHYTNGHLARSRIKAVVVENQVKSAKLTYMYGYDHTDISRISSYTRESADIEEENTGLLFNLTFWAGKGKNRNGVGRRIFRTLMPDAEVLEVRAGFGSVSTGPTVWWWKMALVSLVSLKVVYLSADSQTCANFCEALKSLMKSRPRDFPRLRTLYVHKYSEKDIDRHWEWRAIANPSYSEDYDPLDVPRTNFQHLLELARAYIEAGHLNLGMMMTGDNSNFGYGPGVREMRDISSVVSSFSYLRMSN